MLIIIEYMYYVIQSCLILYIIYHFISYWYNYVFPAWINKRCRFPFIKLVFDPCIISLTVYFIIFKRKQWCIGISTVKCLHSIYCRQDFHDMDRILQFLLISRIFQMLIESHVPWNLQNECILCSVRRQIWHQSKFICCFFCRESIGIS